jgi:hypothetical protein
MRKSDVLDLLRDMPDELDIEKLIYTSTSVGRSTRPYVTPARLRTKNSSGRATNGATEMDASARDDLRGSGATLRFALHAQAMVTEIGCRTTARLS